MPGTKRKAEPLRESSKKTEGSTSIFIGNLAWAVDETAIRKAFSACGEIKEVRFTTDKETGVFKGYGHVEFADTASTDKAVKVNGADVCGRAIRVDFAAVKEKKRSSYSIKEAAKEEKKQSKRSHGSERERVEFTKEEDDRLLAACRSYPAKKDKPWAVIASKHTPARHMNDIRKRWETVVDPSLKKGEWSAAEDASLVKLVKMHGTEGQWNGKIQRDLLGGNRTGKQCKQRWECKLDPNLASGDWSAEEDASLITLVGEKRALGAITLSVWAAIAREKAGGARTNKQCKRRWTKVLDPDRVIEDDKKTKK